MANEFSDLGDLERDVMQLVWAHAPITADDVRKRLKRRLKDSTIRTVLRRLTAKGFVTYAVEGRTFLYRSAETREHVAAKAVKRIIDWFGNGSLNEVLVGMVDTAMLDQKDLEGLEKTIKAAKKGRK